jgi:hypothetical protein
LPTGLIEDVDVLGDSGLLAEAAMQIGGRPLLLMAGEVYEEKGDRLAFVRCDESVLAFTDPSHADTVNWRPPREARHRV